MWTHEIIQPTEPGDEPIEFERLSVGANWNDLEIIYENDGRFFIQAVDDCNAEIDIGTADLQQQHIQEVETATKEPKYLAVWELEAAVYAWLDKSYENDISAKYLALSLIKDGSAPGARAAIGEHVLRAHADTQPETDFRIGSLNQAINNVAEQLRQRLAEREAASGELAYQEAAWELRLYLENADRELKRIAARHEANELVSGVVTAVCSSIGLSVAELKRAIKAGSQLAEEEE